MRTIAVINQKGGCGKTTTSINLAAAMADAGRRTLLVDMDPQGHCGLGLAVPESQLGATVGEALLTEHPAGVDFNDVLWQISARLDLAPASPALAALEAKLVNAHDRDVRLARVLATLQRRYDVCIIDCPPSIGLLTFNALRAASEVIIPVDAGYFALRGSIKQVTTLQVMAQRCGHRMGFHILPNMIDPAQRGSQQFLQEMHNQFGERVLPIAIAWDAALREAAGFGQPVLEYAAESRGADAFVRLAAHLIAHAPADAAGAVRQSPGEPSAGAAMRPAEPGEGRLSSRTVEQSSANEAATSLAAAGHHAVAPTIHLAGPAVNLEGSFASPPARPQRQHDAAEPRQVESGARLEARPGSRVADLLERARALAQRTEAMQESISRDPQVARLAHEPEQEAMNVDVARPPGSLSQKLKRFYGVRSTAQGVLFVQPQGEARRVCLAGDFNEWSTVATPMRRNARLHVWEACIPLPPGRYRYRLVFDGEAGCDPHNARSAEGDDGEPASVLEVQAR